MNKLVKVISILLIALMIVAVVPQSCFAADAAIKDFADGQGYQSNEIGNIKTIAQKVLVAIRNIAIIAAVIIISILGVKYMIGSVEEKAGYKKAFMPLIVGAILIVSATQIATMLFSLKA